MSKNHNSFSATGNLGKDPEMRLTPTGKAVTTFSVAVNDQYTNAAGEKVKETLWVKVTAWGNQAEVCNKYLKKGDKIFFEGRLKPLHFWDGQDGEKHADIEVSLSEVEFLTVKDGSAPEVPVSEPVSDIPF
jgi:single-strand DNA-binding protein